MAVRHLARTAIVPVTAVLSLLVACTSDTTPTGSPASASGATTAGQPSSAGSVVAAGELIGRDDHDLVVDESLAVAPRRILRTELAPQRPEDVGAGGAAASSPPTTGALPSSASTASSSTSTSTGSPTTSASSPTTGAPSTTAVVPASCAALDGKEQEVCELASRVAGSYLTSTGTPGAAIGVVLPGGDGGPPVQLELEFGEARPDLGAAASAGTLWEIGSETKLLTAALLSQLLPADGGPISMTSCGPVICMSDKLSRFVPAGVTLPPEKQDITIGMLVTHTSGLPDPTPNPYAGLSPQERERCLSDAPPEECLLWRSSYTAPMLWEGVATAEMAFAPGTGYLYSDLAFAALGQVLADLAGTGSSGSYAPLAEGNLTGPLGLTTLGPEDVEAPALAQGFRYRPPAGGSGTVTTAAGTQVVPAPYFENSGAFIGAGGFVSTIGDMTRFTAAVLGYAPGQLTSALTRTLVPIETCAFQGGSCGRPGQPVLHQGMAWEIHATPTLACGYGFKNGGTTGFHSATAVVPDRDYGVTALSNAPTYANALAVQIALGMAAMFPPARPTDAAACGPR